MIDISSEELNNFTKSCHELIASQQTLLLATASANCTPDISYAPFVRDRTGIFYIYVSELAGHTNNLLNNPQASILFIRPETEARNLFVRERAVFSCRAKEIARDDDRHAARLDALQEKFGEVVGVLRSLSDFHLFALCPETGRYVAGFGRAFAINVNNGSLGQV
ncbi:MAG: pyridoxamine 5'-phosphate oxidase family protein [Methylobacter sp.]|nr:pyridoxamine 5'-phosphate oxidase family protein [Methylobacter sp.]